MQPLCAITEKLHLTAINNSTIMVYRGSSTFRKWQHLFLLTVISFFIKSCISRDDKPAKNNEAIESIVSEPPHYSQPEKKNDKPVWNLATFDPKICKAAIYAQLDKQEEIYSAFVIPETLTKRTSDVEYSTGKKSVSEFNNLKVNNCHAYFYQSDTLFINIGIGNGFTSQGFLIKFKDKKFYTEPYYFTDLIIPDEPEPKFKIVYQKLILNNPTYKFGDSLFGYIDFKAIETVKGNKTKEHWGKGYFRARVTET